ncbi:MULTISPECIES: efflux transporter outer membrane subunit [Methylomonas]|uniref:RND transporter n=2 Tax=Methylomonas TaxID=416 RepID=A0A126T4N5_9GAMM|nr:MULTISPECIES: efflux transporter outer membrane subunit [Methylomonas]AMK77055.1 RND transporter [Methylomonas denitrificans]OAH96237.1 RND transporter [Methylomonas methanica]TCV76889.1 NodT family efflux transporter outer membrane factor (OMF) lipoprotein [Methylomonas methanica]
MKRKIYCSVAIALLSSAFSGCSLNTELSIPEKPIPASFQDQSDTTSIANIDWRHYFSDTLLLKLIDTAINNNPDLQIALQRIESSRSSVKLANAAMLPQVSLNVGGGVEKFGLYTMDGAGNATTEITPGRIVPENYTNLFVGLQSSWEIDVWGKLENQRKSAVSNYLSSIEATNFVISNLVADVAIYYNELLALDHELDIVRQTIKKQQEALEIIKLQKEAGRANELAVQQFRAQLLDTQVLENGVLQQISEAENQINFLLGRYPQPIERAKNRFFEAGPPVILSGIPSQLLSNRPDIREAELQVEASKFDLKAAKAAFYPNFNITASLGFQAFNPEFLFTSPASLAYSLAGTLVAPIINMKSLEAAFNTAQANQLSAMYRYQKTILNAYVEVANQLSSIKSLQQISTLKKQQSEALKQSVESSSELYKAARASYLEVLIAQQSALQSNLELINVTKRQRMVTITIYKALGGGWK